MSDPLIIPKKDFGPKVKKALIQELVNIWTRHATKKHMERTGQGVDLETAEHLSPLVTFAFDDKNDVEHIETGISMLAMADKAQSVHQVVLQEREGGPIYQGVPSLAVNFSTTAQGDVKVSPISFAFPPIGRTDVVDALNKVVVASSEPEMA